MQDREPQREHACGRLIRLDIPADAPLSISQDALWSSLLNSPQLPTYLDLNRQRLLAAYSLATAFLDSHSIPYSPASAGHFVMINLARFLPTPPGATPSAAELHQLELQLMHEMIAQGVYVAPGVSYAMEGAGHFRLTFSLKREALVVSPSHSLARTACLCLLTVRTPPRRRLACAGSSASSASRPVPCSMAHSLDLG